MGDLSLQQLVQRGMTAETRLAIKAFGLVVMGERLMFVSDDNKNWHLPGGELKPDQDLIQCVEENIYQETGLLVRTGRLFSVYEDYDINDDCHFMNFIFHAPFDKSAPLEKTEAITPRKKHKDFLSIDNIADNDKVQPRFLKFGHWTAKNRMVSRAVYQGLLDDI